MNRINAIYARQSVDRADSISIESQIEFCKYELKGGSFREYKDRGYSGKNTTRPQLQQLLADIRRGEVEKVIVYKLDRISRSILDFSNMMELFQQYQVEFVSSTEKFDTSTPMGRAMLNICIVFAQLERETIQKRVCDAYYSRSQKGFHMGGKAPYGYRLEEIVMDGIHTKKLVEKPEEGEIVREIFRMYCPAGDFLWRHHPVLYGKGSPVLWKSADPPNAGTAAEESGICACGYGCVPLLQKPGDKYCQ